MPENNDVLDEMKRITCAFNRIAEALERLAESGEGIVEMFSPGHTIDLAIGEHNSSVKRIAKAFESNSK
jgi:hypothetical protein